MADKMMRVAGRGTDGTAKPLAVNDVGHVMTTLQSRRLVRLNFLEPTEIREVSSFQTEQLDLTAFKQVTFFVKNSHNVPIRLRVQLSGSFVGFYEDGEFKTTSREDIIVPNMQIQNIIINDALPRILNYPLTDIRFQVNTTDIVPSSGSLQIYALGVKI